MKRLKDRIRKITSRKRGNSLQQIVEEVSSYLRGWIGYFGYCQTPSVLQQLEQWIRRKLRCLVWKRWKRSTTRFKRLRAMGLSIRHAREGAGNGCRGPWRMSASPPLQNAFSIAHFETLGLPRLICRNPA